MADKADKVERVSALEGAYNPGRIGIGPSAESGEAGVVLCEVRGLILHQISAWPDSINEAAKHAAQAAGVAEAPAPGEAIAADSATQTGGGALLRIEPLKWWMIDGDKRHITTLPAAHGAVLDLSHSRTRLRITGACAAQLLNRHLPLDLREASFAEGAVASGAFHHVGVTLWRSALGYELFVPRGFALSVWEMLLESAAQFGAEVR